MLQLLIEAIFVKPSANLLAELMETHGIPVTTLSFPQMEFAHLQNFRDVQAAMAAFFSACFLFLAGSPVNITPANSTVQVNTGRCPNPDLKVVYAGSDAPTL